MPGRRVTFRTTHYERIVPRSRSSAEINFGKRRTDERAGYNAELYVLVIGIIVNLMFLIGCIMFFEIWPLWVYNAGLWLFFVASILNAGLSAYAMWELRVAKKRTEEDFAKEVGSRDEFLEHVLYLGSGVAFAIGSILWMPWIYGSEWDAVRGHAGAAWLFIMGSLGLVLASIWNAFGLVEESVKRRTKLRDPGNKVEMWCRRIASLALCCTALGGSLFVAGSFLFRPGFENDCGINEPLPYGIIEEQKQKSDRYRWHMRGNGMNLIAASEYTFDVNKIDINLLRKQNETHAPSFATLSGGEGEDWPTNKRPHHVKKKLFHNPFCVDILRQGTWIYLWGSLAFFLQSVLSLLCSVILQHYSKPTPLSAADEYGAVRKTPSGYDSQ